MTRWTILALLWGLLSWANAFAVGPVLQYPDLDPQFHIAHYSIAFDFTHVDPRHPGFDASEELLIEPLHTDLRQVTLDSTFLEINTIVLRETGEALPFSTAGEELRIELPRSFAPGESFTLGLSYHSHNQAGVYFVPGNKPGKLDALYTHSEPSDTRTWFPCLNYPGNRSTFEAYIKVPSELTAVSNGALIDVRQSGNERIFHWKESVPVPSYLFAVYAGHFAVEREIWNGIPLEYYAPAAMMADVRFSLRRTREALKFLTDLTGHPYAFEKYAQIVPPTNTIGMENVTATNVPVDNIHPPELDEEFSTDRFLAHELAHHWFGDLVTINMWNDLWLNEGFAVYLAALFLQHVNGGDAMLEDLTTRVTGYFSEEKAFPLPMTSTLYKVDTIMSARSYYKGAWVIRMLRDVLGEDAFFAGIRQYIAVRSGKTTTTADFEAAMEQASGRDLSWFFEQWTRRPGYPEFEVDWDYDDVAREVVLGVTQKQDTRAPGERAGTVPVFQGPVNIEIDGTIHRIDLGTATRFRLPAPTKPRYVNFDAGGFWLAHVDQHQTPESWASQLRFSTDSAGRRAASLALGALKSYPALRDCAFQEKSDWIRSTCIRQASKGVTADDLRKLLQDKSWKIRAAAAAAVEGQIPNEARGLLNAIFATDKSPSVLEAAVGATKALANAEATTVLLAQLSHAVYADKLRVAALTALVPLGSCDTLSAALQYAAPDMPQSSRQAALSLLATSAAKASCMRENEIHSTIALALSDGVRYVRRSAIAAVRALRLKEFIPRLREIESGDADIQSRMFAKEAITEVSSDSRPKYATEPQPNKPL